MHDRLRRNAQVVPDNRCRLTAEEAEDSAMSKARFVAEKHGLSDLTDRMVEHVKKKVAEVYGPKKRL